MHRAVRVKFTSRGMTGIVLFSGRTRGKRSRPRRVFFSPRWSYKMISLGLSPPKADIVTRILESLAITTGAVVLGPPW